MDTDALKGLKGRVFEELKEDWAHFIYYCRKEGFRRRMLHDYDYVCGWIADKNVAKLSKLIMQGKATAQEFLESILPNLSYGQQFQLSLNTTSAVQCIRLEETGT